MSQPSHHNTHTTHLLLTTVLLLPGCAAKEREAATALQGPGQGEAYGVASEQDDTASPPGASEPAAQRDADEAETELWADVALLASCGIEAPTVYFEYDSANVRRAAQIELGALADCLARPPLADSKLQVIGHADERGTEQYNDSLGMRRANAVVEQLVEHGLDRSRVEAHSRGEHAADPPPEWSDRRVVIRLVDGK